VVAPPLNPRSAVPPLIEELESRFKTLLFPLIKIA
jgi:hypothetical protein